MALSALITGATGFVGSHLAENLVEHGYDVVGLSRSDRAPQAEVLRQRGIPLESLDITDQDRLTSLLGRYQPAALFHLAGQASVPASLRDPAETWRVNFMGTRALLQAVANASPSTRVLLVSTGAVYGMPPADELPIVETTIPRPGNPYAASKLAADWWAADFAQRENLAVVIARPLNHIGPRQEPTFAIASFAQQIAQWECQDGRAVIRCGRLDVIRDFTDVRDVVEAYRLLHENAAAGTTFVIASGRSQPLGELLDILRRLARRPIDIVQDPALLRPNDPLRAEGSAARLTTLTGWKPRFALETTLRDTLDYWRERLTRAH